MFIGSLNVQCPMSTFRHGSSWTHASGRTLLHHSKPSCSYRSRTRQTRFAGNVPRCPPGKRGRDFDVVGAADERRVADDPAVARPDGERENVAGFFQAERDTADALTSSV